MAGVLAESAKAHGVELVIHRVDGDDDDVRILGLRRKESYIRNVRKAKHQLAIIERAELGDQLGLMDVDMMITGPVDPILAADLTITVRPPKSAFVFNSGVVFVRISQPIKQFFRQWYEASCKLLTDPSLHKTWRRHYGGINQAAFGMLMNHGISEITIDELPCEIWNCEHETWKAFGPQTRLVHVCLGDLRRACLDGYVCARPHVMDLAARWRNYERLAIENGYGSQDLLSFTR